MGKALKALRERAEKEIKNDEDLLVLSAGSAILAGLGLHLDNQLILIAAMLICPFLNPLISSTIFLLSHKFRKTLQALASFFLMALLALAINIALFYFLPFIGEAYITAQQTGFYGEYFLVAVVSGMIGMLLWLWPETPTTSAGIAIAISLMPPLANSGKLLISANGSRALLSLSAFFLNTLGVLLGSFLSLLFKFRGDKLRKDQCIQKGGEKHGII